MDPWTIVGWMLVCAAGIVLFPMAITVCVLLVAIAIEAITGLIDGVEYLFRKMR